MRIAILIVLVAASVGRAETPDAALYRGAREDLARGAYARAAVAFAELVRAHPQSEHAGDALYWQAFALYKTSDTVALRAAQRALDVQAARYPGAPTHGEARILDTRICGELARRGNARCAEQIAHSARQPCGHDADELLIAALDALEQMDSPQAMPALRTVLARQDICSERVRQRAVLLMAEQEPEGSVDILLDVIREDPSNAVRMQAVSLLPDLPSARVVGVLDSLVQSASDAELRQRAVQGIASSGSRGRRVLYRLIEQPDVGDDVRGDAIESLARYHGSAEEGAFLRGVFARLEAEGLREKAIEALGRMPSSANRRWLVDRALDAREPMHLRKSALFAAGQTANMGEFVDVYAKLREPEMKQQAIYVFGSRGGRSARAKLEHIARTETDAVLRDKASFWLAQSHED